MDKLIRDGRVIVATLALVDVRSPHYMRRVADGSTARDRG